MTSKYLSIISGNNRAYLFLTFTTLCWSGNAVFSRLAVGEVSPMMLITLRWTSVMLLLLVFGWQNLKRDWSKLRPRLGVIMLMGAFGFTGFNALFYLAAYSTTAINIGILQGTIPVFVLLAAFVVFKAPATPFQIMGVIITLTGVVLVASGGSVETLATLAFNHGDVLMLIACCFYAGYTLALRFKPDVSALSFFMILALSAFMSTLPLLGLEVFIGHYQPPSLAGWILIAAIAIFPSFLAQISFINGVTLIGPARAGIFVNLVPVFAAFMAVIFLGEPFEMYHGAALAMVLGGIWLSERGKPS